MGALGFIRAVIMCGLIVAITNWWDNRKEMKEKEREASLNQDAAVRKIMTESLEESKKVVKEVMEQTKGTRDLFQETLTKIGCQYELAEEKDDNRIFFAYQGEKLFVDAQDDALFIHIWDPNWEQVELYDVDKLARLKKNINEANINYYTTTFYTINESGSTVDVHCRASVLFISEIPQIEDYLRSVLDNFFRVHQFVGTELAKLEALEESK